MSRLLVLSAALLAVAACRDGTSPDPVLGTYHLVTIDGQALPFIHDVGSGTTVTVTEGYVRLDAGGAGAVSYTSILQRPDTLPVPATVVTEVQWALVSGEITVTDRFGTRRRGTLQADGSMFFPPPPYHMGYRK